MRRGQFFCSPAALQIFSSSRRTSEFFRICWSKLHGSQQHSPDGHQSTRDESDQFPKDDGSERFLFSGRTRSPVPLGESATSWQIAGGYADSESALGSQTCAAGL